MILAYVDGPVPVGARLQAPQDPLLACCVQHIVGQAVVAVRRLSRMSALRTA